MGNKNTIIQNGTSVTDDELLFIYNTETGNGVKPVTGAIKEMQGSAYLGVRMKEGCDVIIMEYISWLQEKAKEALMSKTSAK